MKNMAMTRLKSWAQTNDLVIGNKVRDWLIDYMTSAPFGAMVVPRRHGGQHGAKDCWSDYSLHRGNGHD